MLKIRVIAATLLVLLAAGLVALGIGQITAQKPIESRIQAAPMPPVFNDPESAAEANPPPTGVLEPEAVPMPSPELTLGYKTVNTITSTVGYGGGYLLECSQGRLPWNGGCRSHVTGIIGCDWWNDEFESTHYKVPCDGQLHYFPSKTYWVKSGNTFYNVGTLTPRIQMPYVCDVLEPITKTQKLQAHIPTCVWPPCQTGETRCICEDTFNLGYQPDPTCCPPPPAGWTRKCGTAWAATGGYEYCDCCYYDQNGTLRYCQ